MSLTREHPAPLASRLALVALHCADDMRQAWGARRRGGVSAEIEAFNARVMESRAKIFDEIDGIAVVPVRGVLLNDWGALDPWWGITGYDGIMAKVTAAAADPEVRGIVFDIASGGGEVAGVDACARAIREAGEAKPVVSILNEEAYSAAYWLASATHSIAVPKTGGVGSIGVVALHADFTKALDEWGVKVTVLRAGARKAEGNPYEPLGDATRADWQAEMDAIRQLFVETVAANRDLDPKALLATEARCIPAITGEALKLRLADAVASPAEAWAAFAAGIGPATGRQ